MTQRFIRTAYPHEPAGKKTTILPMKKKNESPHAWGCVSTKNVT